MKGEIGMKRLFLICTVVAGSALAASPSIRDGSVSFQQDSGRNVTIGYVLDGTPAVVTVDILTNGVSIGESTFSGIAGAVNRLVKTGPNTITWAARAAWPDMFVSNVTVKVTAWPTNAPPDYCVVDLTTSPYDVRYYVSTNALPDGGLTNRVYCRDKLVLRRIHAAGETFRMGQASSQYGGKQMPHIVQLSADYYMAIYELTAKQYNNIAGTTKKGDTKFGDPLENPLQYVELVTLRGSGFTWPQNGHDVDSTSFLGTLRSQTGFVFDLPTDAQWEFACRAGTTTRWSYGTGSGLSNAQKAEYGWFGYLTPYVDFYGTTTNATTGAVTTNNTWGATHPVGLLKPNPWGLYDMHGNAWETCLDYFVNDVNDWNWVSNDYHDPVTDPMGVPTVQSQRVGRGGSQSNGTGDTDSSIRHYGLTNEKAYGIRLVCPALATR